MKNIYLIIIGILISFSLFSQDYSQVYLIGGATPNGWDNGNAQKMTLVESTAESAVFSWTGVLNQSDFKFINLLNTWMPCFNAATDNEAVVLGETHSLVYNTNNNAIDYKFIIGQTGVYTVTVDLKKLTMSVISETIDNFDEVWVTGSAIPNTTMKLSKGLDNIFIYGGELHQGDLKFMSTSTPGENTKYFVPVLEDNDITGETSYRITNDANVSGWYVTVNDPLYKVKVNTLSKTSTAQIVNTNKKLYIVGGATEAGWNAGNAIELQQDEQNKTAYTFDGVLKIRPEYVESNAFKLLGQMDWNPISLHAINANDPILGATLYAESTNGSYADNKWTIEESQQGKYLIKINTLYETIESQYIVGETAIETINQDNLIKIYSITNGIHIRMLDNNSADLVQLMSLDGRWIYSQRNLGNEFDIVNKNIKGIFILKIESNKKQFARQIIIN
ncbi:MAG: SusF/SusE family outer membrane protein [Paludibacter sp.]|nr:SusF/SusE family outer membrane protein [Paludibacter sp.]